MKKLIFIISILAVALVAANVAAFSAGFSSPAFAVILIAGDVQLVGCAVQAICTKQRQINRINSLRNTERLKPKR